MDSINRQQPEDNRADLSGSEAMASARARCSRNDRPSWSGQLKYIAYCVGHCLFQPMRTVLPLLLCEVR